MAVKKKQNNLIQSSALGRERERQRDRQTDRETDRQTDRQTEITNERINFNGRDRQRVSNFEQTAIFGNNVEGWM